MRIQIYPYVFRKPVQPSALEALRAIRLDIGGATAMYRLHMAGIAFRPYMNGKFNAVALRIGPLPPDVAALVDAADPSDFLIANDPDAAYRIVFRQLDDLHRSAEYPLMQFEAFRALAVHINRPLLEFALLDNSVTVMGRPSPGLSSDRAAVNMAAFDPNARRIPLTRQEAVRLFRLNDRVALPEFEYVSPGTIDPARHPEYIWGRIIPAAFTWYHYFEHVTDERWHLKDNGYTFKDCIATIGIELYRLGVPADTVHQILGGRLMAAYSAFTPRPSILYDYVGGRMVPYVSAWQAYWNTLSEARKQAYWKRHYEAKQRRAHSPKPPIKIKHEIKADTLEELDALLADGKISRNHYLRYRRRFREREKEPI